MALTKLSLFSGIGGDDLASEWAGIRTVAFVERDKFCQQVLGRHWPGIPIIGDVHEVTKETLAKIMDDTKSGRRGLWETDESGQAKGNVYSTSNPSDLCPIDIISGGFPCQPHSVAGKREGSGDERDLWPEFRRIIGEIRPRYVVGENVPGLFASDGGLFFNGIISDLAALGYSVGWCTFGAVDVGAWHRRDRVFIVAYAGHTERTEWRQLTEGSDWRQSPLNESAPCREDVADTDSRRCEQRQPEGHHRSSCGSWGWTVEPDVGRVAHGVPRRVDRLRALGNAVVPQQIYPIYKAIAEIESERRNANGS